MTRASTLTPQQPAPNREAASAAASTPGTGAYTVRAEQPRATDPEPAPAAAAPPPKPTLLAKKRRDCCDDADPCINGTAQCMACAPCYLAYGLAQCITCGCMGCSKDVEQWVAAKKLDIFSGCCGKSGGRYGAHGSACGESCFSILNIHDQCLAAQASTEKDLYGNRQANQGERFVFQDGIWVTGHAEVTALLSVVCRRDGSTSAEVMVQDWVGIYVAHPDVVARENDDLSMDFFIDPWVEKGVLNNILFLPCFPFLFCFGLVGCCVASFLPKTSFYS